MQTQTSTRRTGGAAAHPEGQAATTRVIKHEISTTGAQRVTTLYPPTFTRGSLGMKFGVLKSIGHNIADSLASGAGLLVGVYFTDVFMEAGGQNEGFLVVDFLAGTTTSETVSDGLLAVIGLYRDELPKLCIKHGVCRSDFVKLQARYGTDSVYGRHFTVTVEDVDGKHSAVQYVGVPGRHFRRVVG